MKYKGTTNNKPTLAVYCARSWRISTFLTTGKIPMTAPPLTAETINLQDLKAEIVYIRLHGLKGQPYLYGSPRWETAISAAQVEQSEDIFVGSLVYLEGCHGNEMAQAFLNAGARAVVGDTNTSWGKRFMIGPSSAIGKHWLKLIKKGITVNTSLLVAVKNVEHLPGILREGMFVMGDKGATI